MTILKRLIDIKSWKKKTKTVTILVIVALIACCILGTMTPSEEEMLQAENTEIQQMIEKQQNSTRKNVSITYNDLWIINYSSFSTSGANALSEKHIGFAGHKYAADEGAAKVVGQLVNYTYRMLGVKENVLHGAKLTVILTTFTVIIGVVLGVFLALGKISKFVPLSKLCSAYIFFFRGTPLLIQLFVVYFATPAVFGFAWKDVFPSAGSESVYYGAFFASVIAFGLNSGAYCAEIVRAAIQSIDKGQHEAAKSLGMTYGQTMSLIVIPQSVRRMIPPICNEFIMVLKDASLVFAISLMDITTISKGIMTSEMSYLGFVPALIIYLIITAFFSWIFNKIEKKFSVYE